MPSLEEYKRQKKNLDQLSEEEAGRETRIKNRRRHQEKLEAERRAKRRIRMAKMAGIWIGVIVVGLYALTWFSKDFVDWLHRLIN